MITNNNTNQFLDYDGLDRVVKHVLNLLRKKTNLVNGNYLVKGTQTTSTNKWIGELPQHIEEYEDGLTIDYYLPSSSTSTDASLNLSNKGEKPVLRIGGAAVTNQYPAKSILHMTYVINNSLNSGNGCWLVTSYYNSDSQVRIYKDENGEFPVLGSRSEASKITSGSGAHYAEIASNITLNPSTGSITATTFKGKATGLTDDATININQITGLNNALEEAGKVKTVNKINPDSNGNIELASISNNKIDDIFLELGILYPQE